MPTLQLDSIDCEVSPVPIGVVMASTPAPYGTVYELVFDHIMGIVNSTQFPVVKLVNKNGQKYTKVQPESARPASISLIQRDITHGEIDDFRDCNSSYGYQQTLWTLEIDFREWVLFEKLSNAFDSAASRYVAGADADGLKPQALLVQALQPRDPKPSQPEVGSQVTVTLISGPATQLLP